MNRSQVLFLDLRTVQPRPTNGIWLAITPGGFYWPMFPLLGWGIGLAFHVWDVYAPGLSPMDFHAVFEAAIDGHWYVFDATRLAPRQTMLRISTGRDAADTAFLATLGGELDFLGSTVFATTDAALPVDDGSSLVVLG